MLRYATCNVNIISGDVWYLLLTDIVPPYINIIIGTYMYITIILYYA